MKIVFFINYLNHHQIALTDKLYQSLRDEFLCVCTKPHNLNELKGGKDYSIRPYCINATDSAELREIAYIQAREADVCLFGAESLEYAVERARCNTDGLSFEIGERWFKKGWINLLSPRFIKWLYCYYRYFRKRKFYRLCASAFAAKDLIRVGAYKNRCFKWGYFINGDIETRRNHQTDNIIRIMWCGRFIDWKHPELPVMLAARLKAKAYNFVVDMYGCGEDLESGKRLARKLDVMDVVHFHGSHSNHIIRQEMNKHDIFLATSDRNEGWGVVLNEAMSCGCAVIASDMIGSVPYLIEDGVNGLIFKSGNIDALEKKVVYFLENQDCMSEMSQNARVTLKQVWSPDNAVNNLLTLIKALKANTVSNNIGPCQSEVGYL